MMTKKLTPSQARPLAEIQFIEHGKTAKEIAEDLGYSEATICKWRKGKTGEKDWDTRRGEFLASPHKIKELLLKELKLVAEGEKTSIDADALAKISKVIDAMSDKVSVQMTMSVFIEFDNWMASQDPKEAINIIKWHKLFILYKASLE